jgi:hypothetical protein
VYPPKYDAGNKALPRLKPNALARARPFALYVRQPLDKPARPPGSNSVEQVRKLRAASQIIELPLTCEAYPFARNDAARYNVLRIAACNCGVIS